MMSYIYMNDVFGFTYEFIRICMVLYYIVYICLYYLLTENGDQLNI